ncbi:MAG: adenosylcobinamide-GDP ribazoletransferase [Cyanobacteria bacterium J06623_4]
MKEKPSIAGGEVNSSANWLTNLLASWNGALMFYTCLPIPRSWPVSFRQIACWVPWIGLVIGGILALADWSLRILQMPVTVSSGLVVVLGIALTGGLHLDGVMDTADGLSVPNPERRLAVMADSRMGAFGGMAATALILLKVLALSAIAQYRGFVLVAIAVWGRWAQQWAIGRYPYLKKEGKGALHKSAIPTIWQTLPHLLAMLAISGVLGISGLIPIGLSVRTTLGGLLLSGLVSSYFYRQLGGHTGDTYGAVVEWTEALLLCSLTMAQ